MNGQYKKYGFFQSYDEMQRTFDLLNLNINAIDQKKRYKLPKIRNASSYQKNETFENLDNTDALLYNVPELIIRRKRDSGLYPNVEFQPLKNRSQSALAKYLREMKLSAQIARVSGRYPNTSVPPPPRFRIILPSQLTKPSQSLMTQKDGKLSE